MLRKSRLRQKMIYKNRVMQRKVFIKDCMQGNTQVEN